MSTQDPSDDARPAYTSRTDLAAGFDAFYKSVRDRVLTQTFALTGDLTASRNAVREAFVVTWHHWPKTSRLDDPEQSVRELAWRRAQRRASTSRRRRRGLGDETLKILESLSPLTNNQRRALLLTQMAGVSLDTMAREIGLPKENAERELQLGAAQFATLQGIPTSAIPHTLDELFNATRSATWPRVTILRRAGTARRRTHTIVGGALAVTAMLAAGAFATDTDGSRPTLDRDVPIGNGAGPSGEPTATPLLDTSLLPLADVQRALPRATWQEGATGDNSTGDGRVLPCQAQRYADKQGSAAWIRTFRNGTPKTADRVLQQYAESSRDTGRAEHTYRATVRWFSACPAPEGTTARPAVQLVSSAEVEGLGDQSALFVLRPLSGTRTYVVGVARTGIYTTTAAMTSPDPVGRANRVGLARALGAAVSRLCTLPDGGACSFKGDRPVITDRASYPVGQTPWFLDEVDLPPVGSNHGAWAGTAAADLTADRADAGAIGCATLHLFGKYRQQSLARNQFRSFILSKGDLPAEVGLTETVGATSAKVAWSWIARVRQQIAACPKNDKTVGTEVSELARVDTKGSNLSAWRLTTALPGDRSVVYDVAVVRRGGSLAILVWVGAPRARIEDHDFVAVARRALDRLERFPTG